MPKMKTHSGASKRFRLTGTGKVMRRRGQSRPPARAQAEHANPPLKPEVPVSPADLKKMKRLLGR